MARLRRPTSLLAALVLGLATLVLGAPAAHAADDRIDSYDIVYEVQPSGVLRARETITYRFGDSAGRHGIERDFVVREPYDDRQDAVYDVSEIAVTSPDPVATQFSSRTVEEQDGREEHLVLRIGDPDETVSTPTATYTLSYEVRGALRTFADYDELYWDAIGTGWDAQIQRASVRVTVPGGAQAVSCFVGPPKSTTPCSSADVAGNGRADFAARGLAPGDGFTVGVRIRSGAVTDAAPHLAPDASAPTPAERARIVATAVGGLVMAVVSPLVGVLWWRRHGRDLRYEGLPPGTTPAPGQRVRVVPADPDITIPVAFSPPRIPVAEAGLLVDGQVDTRETAATIVDLAVRGALQVRSAGTDDFRVTLLDPGRAAAPHEMVLLNELFRGEPPGAVRDLSKQGALVGPHKALQTSVINQVASRHWFRKVPSATLTGSAGFGCVAVAVFFAVTVGATVLVGLLPLLPAVVTLAVLRHKLRRGQRTADGRAVCDQVEGFRTYLATAEADQLRFEEGEDIFSRYLPWAIIFDLADRWADLCRQLVAMGRLPDETPYWYAGSYSLGYFNTSFLTSSLTTAATPAPSASGGSGTGFGGGSSFGGGGFSGGGGGGGGGGSW